MPSDPPNIELTPSPSISQDTALSVQASSTGPFAPNLSSSDTIPTMSPNAYEPHHTQPATSLTDAASSTSAPAPHLSGSPTSTPSPRLSPHPSLSATLCNTNNTFSTFGPNIKTRRPTFATDRLRRRLWQRPSIQELIGLASLIVTLIALFVYSHRSFVMAKWTERNDILQACAQLIQLRTNATYPQCDTVLAEGPKPPPYLKGNIYRAGVKSYKLGKRVATYARPHSQNEGYRQDAFPPSPYQTTSVAPRYGALRSELLSKSTIIITLAIVCPLCALLLFGFAIIVCMRPQAPQRRSQGSAARIERPIDVVRTSKPEAATTSVERPFEIKIQYPSRERIFKQIRRRLRKQRDTDEESVSGSSDQDSRISSSETLLDEFKEHHDSSRRVSLTTDTGEHHQEGLVELDSKDDTRKFVDLNTGETFYISPWKSTPESDGEDHNHELFHHKSADIPAGTIKRAIAEMVTGAAALGEGKTVEDLLVEKSKQYRIERVPQRTGDCFAGLVSNE